MKLRPRTLPALMFAALLAAVAALVLLTRGATATGNVGAQVRQEAPLTGHVVRVQGHGEFTAVPDRATIQVGVQSHAGKAQSALSKNSLQMQQVIDALRNEGVPQNHIQTSQLSIWYDSQNDYYVAAHQLTVKLDDVNKVGAVLDAAVARGANNSWGVYLDVKDPSAARSKAMQDAITDSRRRAESMAAAMGVTISGVGSADETSFSYGGQPYYGAASMAAPPRGAAPAAPPPVQPGELMVTADVRVVYTFR